MKNTHQNQLTSSEIASFWSQYMSDSMAICFNKYALKKIEDPDICPVIEQALNLSENHIKKIVELFKQEHFPIPMGFNDDDVNVDAPRLFSDRFFLHYLHVMSINGLNAYSVGYSTSTRRDVRHFYRECNQTTIDLLENSIDVLLSKGIYSRPPQVPTPDKAEYVESQGFLAGLFEEQRPLNVIEISNIVFDLKKSIMAKTLAMGFSQVAKAKEVRAFLLRTRELAEKHVNQFSSILHQDEIPSPPFWDSDVTDSTSSPFSDRLMMYNAGFLLQTAIAYYGAGIAVSMRADLIPQFTGAIAEDLKVGEDWADIMIKNRWMEKPPEAANRKAMANTR